MDNRVKALVGENWSEFVLMIKDVMLKDSGDYECQVSGPNHTSISKMLKLNVISKLISAHNMLYKLCSFSKQRVRISITVQIFMLELTRDSSLSVEYTPAAFRSSTSSGEKEIR